MERLVVPQGEFDLARYPRRPHETLRAWDAADELLLRHLDGPEPVDLTGRVMIVNDAFGALSVALAASRPTLLSDSFLAHRATRENLGRNALDPASVVLLPSTDEPSGRVDVLLVKVPKSLALLEHELRRLAPRLRPDSVVVGAGMTKHIHRSTLELFERVIGPTHTSLAAKKARLIFSRRDAAADDGQPVPDAAEMPVASTYRVAGEGQHVTAIGYAGVFSADRLDRGTELLLAHLPDELASEGADGSGITSIIDLGCGNGIVGVVAAGVHPQAEVTFIDESYLAVASARATYRATLGDERAAAQARFVVGNGILDPAEDQAPIERGSVDLVLDNPPFHTNNALSDEVAWSMFADAREALRPGGELWVVGNRHLAYHAKLKRLFGNCDVIASNPKFVLLRAIRH
jgi:23S rRNA (guanine1835-N2)-methyltransferase